MSETFVKRGHPELGYGLKPGRHLLGVPPRRDATATLSPIPVPTTDCGLDEAPITALGIPDQEGAPYCVSHGWTGFGSASAARCATGRPPRSVAPASG